MLTLVTLTGNRREAFALCEKYMKRQTYKGPLNWVVVDDGEPATLPTMGQTYIRGPRAWEPGLNTQRFNTEAAIPYIKGDVCVVIEDDDWYDTNYLQTMVSLLKFADIVGVGNARYFNIRIPGWKVMRNYSHSSLSQCAFKKSVLPEFVKAVNSGAKYFDIELWNNVHNKHIPSLIVTEQNISVGIKALPGRAGISPGHTSRDFLYDGKWEKLKSWIGPADTTIYQQMHLDLKKPLTVMTKQQTLV